MNNKNNFDVLKKICQTKFKKLGGNEIQRKRIVEELVFFNKNPSLLEDVVELLKKKISGGDINKPNSFIFYLLGITTKEPDYEKEFTFDFEVDEENRRLSPPDIDIDFEHRDDILNYICGLYGKEKIALIGTANAYKPKAAIQFAAKALDITGTANQGDRKFSSENDREAKRLSKILPNLPGVSLSDFLGEPNKKGEVYKAPNKKVKQAMEEIQKEAHRYPEVFKLAKKLEGMFKAFGTHAAGVVISSNDITEDVALQSKGKVSVDDFVSLDSSDIDLMTTQFDMEDIEEIGLLKFDFLQLDTLRQIRLCQNLILQRRNWTELPFDIEHLETEDPKVLKIIDKCKLEGLFQISGSAFMGKRYPQKNFETGEFLKNEKGEIVYKKVPGVIEIIKCNKFEDIVAANALGRPGPLICDMHREYAKNKKNPDKIEYLHPLLKPILEETYGNLIYQEQMIEMSQKICGFNYKQADNLRYACGKKKKELLDKIKPKFYEGARNNKISEEVIDKLWDISVEFGKYAFNKSHSTAYAEITYITAYLKNYYTEEFICATLTSMANKSDDKLQESLENFKKEYKNLEVIPPGINISKETYVPSDKKMAIIAPLVSLKSVGEKASSHIVSLQPFLSMEHFLESVDKTVVNSKIIQILLDEGSFSCFGDRDEIERQIKKNEQVNSLVSKNSQKSRCIMATDDLFA